MSCIKRIRRLKDFSKNLVKFFTEIQFGLKYNPFPYLAMRKPLTCMLINFTNFGESLIPGEIFHRVMSMIWMRLKIDENEDRWKRKICRLRRNSLKKRKKESSNLWN